MFFTPIRASCRIGKFGLKAAIRCASHQRQLCGTELPYASAAIADAAILRKYGTELAATRQISPNRPFKRRTPAGF